MRVLAFDPGATHTGWGVIHWAGNRGQFVDCGVIERVPASGLGVMALADAYCDKIIRATGKLIAHFQPHHVALEGMTFMPGRQGPFVGETYRTLEAIRATVQARGIQVVAYTRLQVLGAIRAGKKASKKDVRDRVTFYLGLRGPPHKKSHATDALAVCLTHASKLSSQMALRLRDPRG